MPTVAPSVHTAGWPRKIPGRPSAAAMHGAVSLIRGNARRHSRPRKCVRAYADFHVTGRRFGTGVPGRGDGTRPTACHGPVVHARHGGWRHRAGLMALRRQRGGRIADGRAVAAPLRSHMAAAPRSRTGGGRRGCQDPPDRAWGSAANEGVIFGNQFQLRLPGAVAESSPQACQMTLGARLDAAPQAAGCAAPGGGRRPRARVVVGDACSVVAATRMPDDLWRPAGQRPLMCRCADPLVRDAGPMRVRCRASI